ncbi:MAG TPA: autotransporter-associated beta strand repeat-containing protein, partial [Verrucomicrobium sp.]|nr:autotransporter-associated beta strand repeat-containing protein [Verrucomicrobium sp.]
TSVTGKDLKLTGTGNITGQGSEMLNTLKIASQNSITLGAGAVFSVDSILKTGGSLLIPGSPTAVPPVPEVPAVLSYSEISGGEGLTVADEDSDFIVRVNLAVDTLKISSKLLDSIQNGLTKSGQGLLILSNNNAYFGVTNILEGVVQIGHANALGALGAVNRTRVHAGAVLDIVGVSLSEELELLNGGTVGNSSTSAAGTLTGLITLNNGGTLHAVSGAVLNVQSIISGNGGITHTGLGRTLLLSDNLFTGNVNIVAGSLVITKQANLGAGAKVVRVAGGGTSTLEPAATAVLPRFDLDGTSGNITLDQSITYQLSSEGGATVPSGIVNIAGDNVLKGRISLVNGGGGQGRLYVQAGKLTIDGNIDAEGATANRTIFLGGAVNGEGVVNGIISDTVIDTLTTRVVTVAKDGANTWTLNGNNTFTGNLQVTDGVLKFNSASALGSAAGSIVLGVTASIGTEAILQYIGASDAIITRAFSYGNNSGTALGVVRNTSGHLLTLQGAISRNNNWARTVVFQGGQFLVTGAITGNNVGSHTVIDGATVTFTNTTNSYGTNNSATNGANTIVKNGGILKNGASEVLPNSTFVVLGDTANNSAGTYDLNGYNETVRGLSHEGTGTALVTNSAASGVNTLIVTGTSTYSGVIADGATAQTALTKSTGGVLTLSGNNTYTGATNVTGGTLAITTTGILNSKVTVAAGATLDLLGTVKIGGVDSAGNLRIGSGGVTGVATIEGALNTTTGSILYFDLGGASRGATTGGYDAINGLTSLNLTGTLSVSLVAGFVPTENAVFNLIDWTQLGSTFTNSGYAFDFLSADVSALGLKWDTDSFSTTGSIYLVAVPEPGRGLLLVMALGWLVAGRRKRKG